MSEIWLTNREQSKVFKVIFVAFLCATHSFVFVNSAELVRRRQTYPNITTIVIIIPWQCKYPILK
jgi:hypothetical protein